MQVSLDEKLGALSQISQRKLLDILTKISGRKDLIIDSSLIKPLERIVGVSKLRAHGVDKIYKLEKGDIPFTNTQRVFFVNSDLITVKHVSDKINGEISQKNDGNSYHIILVGRKLQSVVNMLETEGTLGYVSLFVFQWELIKLDTKFLSMEFHSLYKSLFVDGDQSYLPVLARSIWTLCTILGRPLVTVVQGKHSQVIDKMLGKMFEELGTPNRSDSEVGCMFIVDRDVDYASSLLTGCTYSCLLDEVFGIKSGIVEIKDNKNDIPGGYFLSSADEVYSQIKGRHFSDVFPYLSTKTKELSQTKEKSQTMAIHEMKQFISKELSAVTNFKKKLAYHISACESIISHMGHRYEGLQNAEQNILESRSRRETLTYIEDCLSMNICDKYAVLRLMCLMSLTQDGLFPDELQRLKLQFFHMFGYQHLTVFHALEKSGLCVEQPALLSTEVKGVNLANKVVQAVPLPTRKSTFTNFAQKLKLFPPVGDNYELNNPTDLSYVFGRAYIPALCQIVNQICKKEITIEDLPKILPNCTVKNLGGDQQNFRTFLIYIVGGVTYAEISAFQLLEKLTGFQIVIASSSTINGNSIMKSFFQQ
ncbi:hypothetical protein GE061_010624 [Apolygus lucorum]|uniref:Vacuolar protein sorting-associated protein 33B n=1 Tax=Apolygus lucorum TaxID=248454 RepID=A0A6A4JZN2_APOLU|nr:hypothetical protein GE061_010624 [Apolygus lucorum]